MRNSLSILALLVFSVSATADEPIWFVSVYGESMQLISGASGSTDIEDGVFLSTDFTGTEIFVRVQSGYELDGFRPYESAPSSESVSMVSESMDAAAAAPEAEAPSMDEFGPLADTGLQYYVNDSYFGWVCSEMFVQPLGDGVYRLRCNDEMEHTG